MIYIYIYTYSIRRHDNRLIVHRWILRKRENNYSVVAGGHLQSRLIAYVLKIIRTLRRLNVFRMTDYNYFKR